jgi:hypothetical protein
MPSAGSYSCRVEVTIRAYAPRDAADLADVFFRSVDLQAEFVKPAERGQVTAHEGSVRHVAPIGHPRHEQVPSLLTESTGFGRHRQISASSSARARPWS